MSVVATEYGAGEWCWHVRYATPCRVVDRQDMWGEVAYRVWLPRKDAVLRARNQELSALSSVEPSVHEILHTASAARLLGALDEDLLLAPIQSTVVPLPHQIYALNRAMSQHRVRYLLADEVGLGKTIEAGLILRELKLRGLVRRALVVAPKGLVRQWQAEMQLHFGEKFQFVDPSELAAFRQLRTEDENLWQLYDQVICSLDSVKPIEGRRGWSLDQVSNYNRERFEDLISAAWDLVIIDEAHRLGGSTDQVARYKLGSALADAAPYLLLLSATPHQGKTDQFMRLIQLLDKESFPDETSVQKERVHPFVIRTEKRAAIDSEGALLFKPRTTRMIAVEWSERHDAQQRLYEAVTSYVRHGYNQALALKQRHIGFLMILMQRLVTSSTAAIRSTLEKRSSLLETPPAQQVLFDDSDIEEWAELDGQTQLELAVRAGGWEREKTEVEVLLNLARETERQGTDAKAEALLDLIYRLQQEENDPLLKILVFTEFVPTQAMLAGYLESRGFSVVTLNGSMDLDARAKVQQAFSRDARILISTDAGGEGLNLQFCHVVVNFDMPWNPMRVEQRIGRVDRIGQPHVVRAVNFVLKDTVEHRVRQVLEDKLAVIAEEFGVDKASDVMDSAEAETIFDDLYIQGIEDPSAIEQDCDSAIERVRDKVSEARKNTALLSDEHSLTTGDARKWRDHPAQFWMERAITNGLNARGGSATSDGHSWQMRWLDGSTSSRVCFDARAAEQNPDFEWITMEDSRARSVVRDIPYLVCGQPIPSVTIAGLPESVQGVWSLWEIGLSSEGFVRNRFLPLFLSDDGKAFLPTARRVWDLLLTESVELCGSVSESEGQRLFSASMESARTQAMRIINELREEHRSWLDGEKERTQYAFDARLRVLNKLGLNAVRQHRLKRVEAEYRTRMDVLDRSSATVPDLNALLMLRIGDMKVPCATGKEGSK